MSKDYVVMGRHSREKMQVAKRLRQEQTPAEALLWECLRKNRLGGLHFRRQQVVDGFITDFYCHEAGLVIEADGAVHNNLVAKDSERDAVFAGRDLRVLHFANEHIEQDVESVLNEILTIARQRKAKAANERSNLPLPVSGRGPGG